MVTRWKPPSSSSFAATRPLGPAPITATDMSATCAPPPSGDCMLARRGAPHRPRRPRIARAPGLPSRSITVAGVAHRKAALAGRGRERRAQVRARPVESAAGALVTRAPTSPRRVPSRAPLCRREDDARGGPCC
eukprot:scaffold1894_cov368-Prasinococcus_capsulatus_cf.AAC.11